MMMWLAIFLVVVGYLVGWVCALRPVMRGWMAEEVYLAYEIHRPEWMPRGPEWTPRGQVRPRNGRDAAVVAGLALLWPIIIVTILAKGSSAAFVWMINRLVPPTAPEREREVRSREAEIAKLIKEIEDHH